MDKTRALLQRPEIVVGTWREARVDAADLTESETRAALARLDTLGMSCSRTSRPASSGC